VLAHGMATSFLVAAIFDACALVVIVATIRSRRPAAVPAPVLAAAAEEAAEVIE
jgi:hypothetical protein